MPHHPSRRYHDRVARQYDAIYDDAYWHFHDQLTWHYLKPHLPRDLAQRCADLGCGTGKWGLKLLKSGLQTTFVDHSAAMIEQTRAKLADMPARARHATLLVADIVHMPEVESNQFAMVLAMGDPLSICSDPARAAAEMFRITAPGGIVIATADNKLAAIDHYFAAGDVASLEEFAKTSKTRWLTRDEREQFDLTTFTPQSLQKLFTRAGFEVLSIIGKPVLPVREYRDILADASIAERLLELELDLAKDATTAARAAHLQITARVPAGPVQG